MALTRFQNFTLKFPEYLGFMSTVPDDPTKYHPAHSVTLSHP